MAQSIFETNRSSNFKTNVQRIVFNLIPAYWCSGGKIGFISSDWQEVHISLRRKLRTRNLVGSVFGGSIYSATDPIYMTQLLFILGKDYVVWDKSAEIHFKKPIYKKVHIRFEITDAQIAEIKEIVEKDGRCNYTFETQFVNEEGVVFAVISKKLFIATKEFYKMKSKQKKEEN